MKQAAFNNELQISDCFDNLAEIKSMREPFGKLWYQTYNNAFNNYVKGNWDDAVNGFKKILEIKSDDKPTKNILEFMEETNFKPPKDWKGYKHFDE